MKYLQEVVRKWICSTMDTETFLSTKERAQRFLEEAIELVQATGDLTKEDIQHQLDTTWARPVGTLSNEVGGTAVCLFALCENLGLDFYEELNREITRVYQPHVIEKVRKRWREKASNGTGIITPENSGAENVKRSG